MNTYLNTIKDDPKDRITVEIGDSKEVDFYPQIKLKRWDNQVNCSFRLLGDTGTHREDGDKIKYESDKREAHFYEVKDAYEFEVILKEKPDTNLIEFSMETKGLEFFYQPELTQEEIDAGNIRPDNVVGSYAVYYKDCPPNYVGGKEYKAGKAFHIYRPRIEDAVGKWVWGELQIDNKMTVTIPQEFLDDAVYPIRHAAGATFGFTSIGGSNFLINSSGAPADTAVGSLFTGAAGDATKLTAHFKDNNDSGGAPIDGALYLHSDLSLKASVVGVTTPAAFAWVDFTFDSSAAISAVGYVPSIGASQGFTTIKYDTGDTDQGHFADPAQASIDDPMNVESHDTHKFSIYVTYTPSGGPAFIPHMMIY